MVQRKCLLPLGLSNFSETRNLFHSPSYTGGRGKDERRKKDIEKKEGRKTTFDGETSLG